MADSAPMRILFVAVLAAAVAGLVIVFGVFRPPPPAVASVRLPVPASGRVDRTRRCRSSSIG